MANARAQAAAEQETAVACCRSSAAAALDNARAHAENRCERLEEGFVRERDRAAVAELVREKAASDLFQVSSLAFGSSVPAASRFTGLLLTLVLELLDGQFQCPRTTTLLMRIRPRNPLARRWIGDGLWLSPSILAGRPPAQNSRAGLPSSI